MIELIVMAHGHVDVDETIKRHIPVWKSAGFGKISFVSPRNNTYCLEGHDCFNIAEQGDYGCVGLCERQLFAFTLAATKEACAVFEYDTICWPEFITQGIPPHGELAIGKKHGDDGYPFTDSWFTHPFTSNWFTHTQFLGLGSTYAKVIPFFYGLKENYVNDRMTAEAINRSGVNVTERSSFSCNSYNTKELIERGVADRKAGTLAVTHGVKTKEALDALMGAI